MAKRVNYKRLNERNVAVGQKVVDAFGDAVGHMTDLAIKCDEQGKKIRALEAENQDLREQLGKARSEQ